MATKRPAARRPASKRKRASRSAVPRSSYAALIAELDAADQNVILDVDGERVTLTNLGKVLWPPAPADGLPAYTRRDLVRYLLRAGLYILPHMKDRPLT